MGRIVACIISALMCSQCLAASLRCGRALVKSGDSINVLMRKCGQPLRKYTSKEAMSQFGHKKKVGVSNWVYGRTGKNDMIVSVRDGKVIQIRAD